LGEPLRRPRALRALVAAFGSGYPLHHLHPFGVSVVPLLSLSLRLFYPPQKTKIKQKINNFSRKINLFFYDLANCLLNIFFLLLLCQVLSLFLCYYLGSTAQQIIYLQLNSVFITFTTAPKYALLQTLAVILNALIFFFHLLIY
jgi:hypothetical protein